MNIHARCGSVRRRVLSQCAEELRELVSRMLLQKTPLWLLIHWGWKGFKSMDLVRLEAKRGLFDIAVARSRVRC